MTTQSDQDFGFFSLSYLFLTSLSPYMSRLVGKPAMWFSKGSDANQTVQSQKQARGLKFRMEVYYLPSENKGARISLTVTAKLICVFVFAYADCWFSHEESQLCIR